jgi:sulfate transport system substrate-binding protein
LKISLALAGVALALGMAGVATGASGSTSLTLVAYSTPKEAYAKIIPAFQKTAAGRDVEFNQSYGASGDQARAVAQGLSADVVEFSLQPDMDSLVKVGIVARSWSANAYHGMVTDSVVVFVVRDGNPKKIHTWGDLLRKGVQVVTPNPFTSGGARWNVMAAYGAQRKAGRSHAQAVGYLLHLFQHVVAQDKSARDSLQTFASGKGDVLLAYENEAIFANKKGVREDYVIPRQTILIENPVAVAKTSKHGTQAKAFVKYLFTPAAQTLFAENGYRPVVPSVARKYRFPKPSGLFTIRQLGLGGWDTVQKRFFDRSNGIMATVERQVGGGTG